MKKFTVWTLLFGIFLAATLVAWVRMQRLAPPAARVENNRSFSAERSFIEPPREGETLREPTKREPRAAFPPDEYGPVELDLEAWDPDELTRLAAQRDRDPDRVARLLLLAAAEGDRRFRYLLEVEWPDESPALDLALEVYDFSVNGSHEALDRILLAFVEDYHRSAGADTAPMGALAYVNEWDRVEETLAAHPVSGDGTGGECLRDFWRTRLAYFPDHPRFPKNYRQFRQEISGK